MAILSRVGFISEPWQNDAGLYISMGKVLSEGQAGLYRVVWDTKFPSVALLVEPFWLLFGRAWWGYILAQSVMAFGASFLFARATRSQIGSHAYWPVLLYGLVPVRPKPLVMTAAVLPAMALSLAAAWPMLKDLGGPVPMAKVIAYLDEHAKPGDAVWADPSPHLTIPTGLRPGMRYVFTHYFINSDAAPAEFSSRMIADLKSRRPRWAVVMASPGLERKHAELESQPGLALNPQRRRDVRAAFATVMDYIETHYERVDELDGFRILRRKDE